MIEQRGLNLNLIG